MVGLSLEDRHAPHMTGPDTAGLWVTELPAPRSSSHQGDLKPLVSTCDMRDNMGRKSKRCACAQVLMYAQLRGNSQSLVKVVSGGRGAVARDWRSAAVAHETPVSALIDGGGDFGMLVVRRGGGRWRRPRRAEHGVGVVGTNNTASGTGALGCVRQHSPEPVAWLAVSRH